MPLSDCLATIRTAAPNLTDDQANVLLDEVAGIVERLQADKKVTNLEAAVAEAVEQRISREARAAVNEKRIAALNYNTRLHFIQRLREVPDQDVPKFLESILAGEEGNSLYKTSIEATQKAFERTAYAMFFRGVEAKGLARGEAISFLRKAKNGQMLLQESYKPGSTGNDIARIIAEAMEETNEYLRKSANKFGADIARMPGYLIKQSHDSLKIHQSGRQAWIDDIIDLLDHGRTFDEGMTDAAKRQYLSNVWDTLITNEQRNDFLSDLSDPPGFRGPGNLAKKLTNHRSLHFANGDAAWSYMGKYARTDVGTSFFGGIDMMTRSVAAMSHLGPNPRAMLGEIVDRAKAKIRGDETGLNNKISTDFLDRLYDEVTGAASVLPAYNSRGFFLARAVNFLKNVSSSAILGGTTLTSIADVGTSAVRLADIGAGFTEAHGSVLAGFFEGRRTGEKREIADSLGIGMDHLIAGVQSRFLGNDAMDGQGSFLVSTVMRVTGMNWMTDTLKTSVSLTLSNYIARQIGKSFDAIHPQLRRELSAYGITADDFSTLSAAARSVEGKSYIDIDAIADDGLALKMKEFFSGFADSAVLTPGARTMALVKQGKRGEPMTEMLMVFMHLKSFSVSYWNEILSRAWKGEGVRVGYGLHLALSMAVYGFIASSLKDFTAGKQPREPGLEALFDAMLTSGGLGFYGDLVIGAVGREERYGEGLAEALGGPVLGTFARSLKALGALAEGDIDGFSYKGMRVAKSMMPGANIFYTRLALDYMFFWQMSEYLRPGWASNFENRVRDETAQEFYLPPTDAVRDSYLN